MNQNHNLSPLPRRLMGIVTIFFGLMGLVLFVAPAWSTANFPWKISPLVAMTMGGWYLGTLLETGIPGTSERIAIDLGENWIWDNYGLVMRRVLDTLAESGIDIKEELAKYKKRFKF